MFQRLTAWRNRRRAAKIARTSAWRTAEDTGDDSLTNFQRLALPALEAVTGPLALSRAGTNESYLTGPILNTDLVLYLYTDEAQVHGATRRFIAEKWDYDSPEALINELVSFVRTSLQSN
jgi:hypothetical protein